MEFKGLGAVVASQLLLVARGRGKDLRNADRLADGRVLAENYVRKIQCLLDAVRLIEREYFDGQPIQFHEAIEMLSGLLSPDHQIVLQLRSERGACLTTLERFGEAEQKLQNAVTGLLASGSEPSASARLAVERLAACQETQGRAEDAARTRAKIDMGKSVVPSGR